MSLLSRGKIGRIEEAALITLFLIAVWLPLLLMMSKGGAGQSAQEKRRLAALPGLAFNRRALSAFRGKFNLYFKDNFGGRATLIRWQAIAKVKYLGVSTSPHVFVGKDGWFYFNGGGGLEGYYNRPPFAPEQLKRWRQFLLARRDWLRARGIPYLIVFAPDKHSIYPEYLPGAIRRGISDVRLDQLLADLKEHTDLDVLDLRPALLEAKQRRQVFLKTDTHWNNYGGFTAYRSLVTRLGQSFPGMTPLQESDCEMGVRVFDEGDIASFLGLGGGLLREDYLALAPRPPDYQIKEARTGNSIILITEHKNQKLPRLLMFRDSFATAMIPFLSQHFSCAFYVSEADHRFRPEMIKTERPDIVVQESVERFLPDTPPEDPPEIVSSQPPR
jgi:alginate O-acetyltransferase complex protein AlgJ